MENQAAKKDWVKNAIIVFLAIMLLLTLFSNTITNYSLPQVSIASAYTGQLTTSIRGTGNVTAGDAYTVKGKESRVIASCLVKKGDHVEKGDPIYVLEDSESSELLKAEDELAELELKYYQDLLGSGMDTNDAVRINNGGASSFNSYIARINEINSQIEACEKNILEKQEMVDTLAVGGKQIDASNKRSKDAAELEQELARIAKEDAQNAFDVAKQRLVNKLNDEIDELNNEKSNLGSTSLTTARNALKTIANGLGHMDADYSSYTYFMLSEEKRILVDEINSKSNYNDYAFLISEATTALDEYREAAEDDGGDASLSTKISELTSIKNDISAMTYVSDDSYKAALDRYNSATISSKKATFASEEIDKDLDAASKYADADLTKYKTELIELKQQRTDLLATINKALDADKVSDDIARKKETIEKLRANAYGATIEAPVSGTIQTLAKVAGESIEPDKELIVIIPDGKDMSVNISVSNDQAKKVKLGDSATLSENLAWNYPDAVLVLEKMSDDTENPGKNTILTFSVSAQDLKVNQSISVVMNTETKDYPIIVPISAVHHDNSGDFIYKLTTKSSALGSRYYATKIGVKKLEQDDSNCAISVTDGELAAYDSVITSSNKTIEAGKLVRLSESSSN